MEALTGYNILLQLDPLAWASVGTRQWRLGQGYLFWYLVPPSSSPPAFFAFLKPTCRNRHRHWNVGYGFGRRPGSRAAGNWFLFLVCVSGCVSCSSRCCLPCRRVTCDYFSSFTGVICVTFVFGSPLAQPWTQKSIGLRAVFFFFFFFFFRCC